METSAQGWHSPDMEMGHKQIQKNAAAVANNPISSGKKKVTKILSFQSLSFQEQKDSSGPKVVATGCPRKLTTRTWTTTSRAAGWWPLTTVGIICNCLPALVQMHRRQREVLRGQVQKALFVV